MENWLLVCLLNSIFLRRITGPHNFLSLPQVMVLHVDNEKKRITLSTKVLEPNPGDMINNPQAVFDNAEEMVALFKRREDARLVCFLFWRTSASPTKSISGGGKSTTGGNTTLLLLTQAKGSRCTTNPFMSLGEIFHTIRIEPMHLRLERNP
jgi:hypothetical protein